MNTPDQQQGPVPVFYIAPQWQQQIQQDQQGLIAAQYYAQQPMYVPVQPQYIEQPQPVSESNMYPTVDSSSTPIEVSEPTQEAPKNKCGRVRVCCRRLGKVSCALLCSGFILTAFILSIIALTTKHSYVYYYGGASPSPSPIIKSTYGSVNGSSTLREVSAISPFVAVSTYTGNDYYQYTVGYGQEVEFRSEYLYTNIDSESKGADAGYSTRDRTLVVSVSKTSSYVIEALLLDRARQIQTINYQSSNLIQKIVSVTQGANGGFVITFLTTNQQINVILLANSGNVLRFGTSVSIANSASKPILDVVSFNTTAIAIMVYDNATDASNVKLHLCKVDGNVVCSSSVYFANSYCSRGPSIVPLQSKIEYYDTTISFMMLCSGAAYNYTFSSTSGASFSQISHNVLALKMSEHKYQIKTVDNRTAIAYAVQDRSLYARIITKGFVSGYNSITYRYETKFNVSAHPYVFVASDVPVSTSEVQVHNVNGQVFFTYQNSAGKYVTIAAGIVGTTTKLLDVDDQVLDLSVLSGQNVKPVIIPCGTNLMYLFYTVSGVSRRVYSMSLIIRGGVRPRGVITATSSLYTTSYTIYQEGNIYSYSTLIDGMKYYAKKNGALTIERKSETGNNYFVGAYSNNALDIKM